MSKKMSSEEVQHPYIVLCAGHHDGFDTTSDAMDYAKILIKDGNLNGSILDTANRKTVAFWEYEYSGTRLNMVKS